MQRLLFQPQKRQIAPKERPKQASRTPTTTSSRRPANALRSKLKQKFTARHKLLSTDRKLKELDDRLRCFEEEAKEFESVARKARSLQTHIGEPDDALEKCQDRVVRLMKIAILHK